MIEINAAFQDNCVDLGLLGRADEGRTRSIVFDCKDILGEYPDAKMIAVITQPCTGKKYSASLSERGTDRILVIERSDTAYPGIINIELRAIIDDDGNKRKSAFYKGKIEASMIGEGDAPGAPVRDMLDRAEERLERLSNIRAEAETLKPDEDATASYDNDNAILKLGIPQGKDGGNVDQDPTDEYCGIVNSRNDSVIDQTLTMAGQAADAKACGERFSEKQDALTDADKQSIVKTGMTSGVAWTAAEQKAARERMGIDKEYELIEEITLTENVMQISRNAEPNGTAYAFEAVAIKINRTNTGVGGVFVYDGSTVLGWSYIAQTGKYFGCETFPLHGYWQNYRYSASSGHNDYNSISPAGHSRFLTIKKITCAHIDSILIKSDSDGFDTGTTIQIYGVRA